MEEGAGFLISFPDFSECIADGETPEEAIYNGMDALQETIVALQAMGLPVPEPGSRAFYNLLLHDSQIFTDGVGKVNYCFRFRVA